MHTEKTNSEASILVINHRGDVSNQCKGLLQSIAEENGAGTIKTVPGDQQIEKIAKQSNAQKIVFLPRAQDRRYLPGGNVLRTIKALIKDGWEVFVLTANKRISHYAKREGAKTRSIQQELSS